MNEPDAHAYDEPRYEDYLSRVVEAAEEAYELDDPKHPTYFERMSDIEISDEAYDFEPVT